MTDVSDALLPSVMFSGTVCIMFVAIKITDYRLKKKFRRAIPWEYQHD